MRVQYFPSFIKKQADKSRQLNIVCLVKCSIQAHNVATCFPLPFVYACMHARCFCQFSEEPPQLLFITVLNLLPFFLTQVRSQRVWRKPALAWPPDATARQISSSQYTSIFALGKAPQTCDLS